LSRPGLIDDAAKPEGGIPDGKTALDAGALGLTAALALLIALLTVLAQR